MIHGGTHFCVSILMRIAYSMGRNRIFLSALEKIYGFTIIKIIGCSLVGYDASGSTNAVA
jgi:hypothetical protein